MRALHIAMLLDNLDDRAFSKVVSRLAPELVRAGAQVTVIGVRKRRNALTTALDLPTVDLGLGDLPTALAIPRMAATLRRLRPDVLFAHGNGASRAAIIGRAIARVPTAVVAVEHVHYSTFYPSFHASRARLRDMLTAVLYPRADLVAAVSPAAADDLERRFPMLRGRVAVLPSPALAPTRARVQAAAARPPVVCSVGNLTPRKGQDVLIRALAVVRRTIPDVRLVVIGREDDRAFATSLRALAHELGLDDALCFTGQVPDPSHAVRDAAVFAHASRTEGFGMSIVEAMALGTPVVVTDCPGGPADIVAGGTAGILVPMDDPAALAAALTRLLNDPDERERLADAGRRRAEAFAPAIVAARYLEIARSVTARP